MTGKKRDLVERIDAYERNDNFGRLEATGKTEKQFSVPNEVTFASLSAKHKPGMPNVDYESIQNCMGEQGGHIHKSAFPMLKGRFVKYVVVGTLPGTLNRGELIWMSWLFKIF